MTLKSWSSFNFFIFYWSRRSTATTIMPEIRITIMILIVITYLIVIEFVGCGFVLFKVCCYWGFSGCFCAGNSSEDLQMIELSFSCYVAFIDGLVLSVQYSESYVVVAWIAFNLFYKIDLLLKLCCLDFCLFIRVPLNSIETVPSHSIC